MEKKEDNDKIYKNILKMLCVYKRHIAGILFCLIGMSFTAFLQPLIIREITDQGMVEKNMENILIYAGLLISFSTLYQIFDTIQIRLFSNVHNGIIFSLYEQVYWKMNRLRIEYFYENGTAEILHTISSDIGNVASVANQMTTLSITSVLQVFGGIIGLAVLDWKMAVFILLFIPLKFLLVYYFSKKKNKAVEQMLKHDRVFSGWLGDCINGIREMKLWGLFYVKHKDFEELQKKMLGAYRENCMVDQYKKMTVSLLDVLLNAMIYVLCGWLIIRGDFTIGSAFAFVTYSGYVVSPISFLIDIKYFFAEIKPSAKRLFSFLEMPEENNAALTKKKILSDDMLYKDVPILELQGVTFGYEKDVPVLKNVNLIVRTGEKIAIIGENGSGKSTLLNLLSGFYQPISGDIKIYGISIKEIGVECIREKIAMVPQKPYLFKGTIEENVDVNRTASFEDVISSCKKSGAISFIKKLENGFTQLVGQDGAKLSGGERQKLAVARALVKKANILILDEATSGFDEESNRNMIHLLHNDLVEKTVIVVTHKYEELEGIESVYKLSEGYLKLVN